MLKTRSWHIQKCVLSFKKSEKNPLETYRPKHSNALQQTPNICGNSIVGSTKSMKRLRGPRDYSSPYRFGIGKGRYRRYTYMKQWVQQVMPAKSPCKHQFLWASYVYVRMHKRNMEWSFDAVQAQLLRFVRAQQWLLLHLSKCGPKVSGPICRRPEHIGTQTWHQASRSLGFLGELPHSSLLCAEYESLKRRPQFAPRQILDFLFSTAFKEWQIWELIWTELVTVTVVFFWKSRDKQRPQGLLHHKCPCLGDVESQVELAPSKR